MISFSSKTISHQKTLAEIFLKRRLELDMELDWIAEKIKISQKYLSALENGDYDQLLSDIYSKNFVRKYAEFLGLNVQDLINLYLEEKELFSKIQSKYSADKDINICQPDKISKWSFIIPSRIITKVLVAIIITVFFGYLGLTVKKMYNPPALEIYYPQKDIIVVEYNVIVEGKTEPGSNLKINNQEILPNNEGYFKEKIDLRNGMNIIKIEAKKKYGKESIVYRQIMVDSELGNYPSLGLLTK